MVRTLSLASLAAGPWALDRDVLAELVHRAEMGSLVHGGAATTIAAAAQRPASQNRGVVAVIPIHGVIERRSSLLGELLGGSSIESLRRDLAAAVVDPEVRGIVLSIDSPGGHVAGVPEFAADLRAARHVKPIVAHVDTTAGSAAYWFAAQANEIVVTQSGSVGSVGCYAVHQDISKALENEGVKVTIISAGEHKVDGNEFEPLSDEARSEIQAQVDNFYKAFVTDIARGRGINAATVESDYGQGRMLMADDALAAGMVDAVGSIDVAVRRIGRLASATPALSAEGEPLSVEPAPFLDRIAALTEDTESVVAHARVRMDLRAKEGRPGLSDHVITSLRTIRDSIDALLPDEPAEAQPQVVDPPPAAPPAPVVPVAAQTAPATPRFRSNEEWLRYLRSK